MLWLPPEKLRPYIHLTPEGWDVNDDAPEWARQEFEQFMIEITREEHDANSLFSAD